MIPRLVCNSVGVRSIARVLCIAVNTVVTHIKTTAGKIVKPPIPLNRTSFEIDELRTYIGNKQNQFWIAYVLCSETKQVIDFIVGKRSKRILRTVVNTAEFLFPDDYNGKGKLVDANSLESQKILYFDGDTPKYYIYFNKMADKGFLHISEIGYTPIILPKK